MTKYEQLIFEKSQPGRRAYDLPELDIPTSPQDTYIPSSLQRKQDAALPEVSELDVVRHFTVLSTLNFGVESGTYPLGSCTMKYNPKICEDIAHLAGFTQLHPYQPQKTVQGILQLLYELSHMLAEITGMNAFTLQPAAGAHGELTGLMMIKAYHNYHGQGKRNKILVPDSAHGTNPASAAVLGYKIVEVASNEKGTVDLDSLKSLLDEEVAALMLTNPNTLGLFEEDILEIEKLVHDAGGLLYYDGANANAILGICRPGDMGFDVVHLNIHKTFATPHGGGGPGSGPVGVKKKLLPFLPHPTINKDGNTFVLDNNHPLSIGKVRSFYGNISVLVRAYVYIQALGPDGLKEVAENAVLNANYMMEKLKTVYELPFDRLCKHEFVLSSIKQKLKHDISTFDIAKRLMDYGFHPPTVYFPLIVKEALMIEPTEVENKENLDSYIEALLKIAEEAANNTEVVKHAPQSTHFSRMDEVLAARKPIVRWQP